MKKLISWNVNGLRACVGKGFLDYFKEADADVFCLQETKLQEGQIDLTCRDIISIGITPRRRGIPALPCLRRMSRSACATALGSRSTTWRAG